jgi:hypothetical protein
MSSTVSTPAMRKPDEKMKKPVKKETMNLEERINATAIETMQLLCECMQKKSQECLTKPTAINTGAFYVNTYYELLEKMLQRPYSTKVKGGIQKRLEVMTANGSFYHGTASKEFFKPIPSTSSVSGFLPGFALKDNSVRPSEALMAILENKCLILIGCGEAILISYYKALLDVLGAEKFDYIFAADGPVPFTLWMNTPKNPLLMLTKLSPLVDGCFVYKGNTELYARKHFNGDCIGFNLLYSGKRYFGFGLKATGETQQELDSTFMAEYNREPMGNKGLTKTLSQAIASSIKEKTHERMKTHQISIEEYQKTNGGKTHVIRSLNIELVKGLMMFDKVSARALFAPDRT